MPTPLVANDSFRVGTASYNNFEFPPARESTASFEPVYSDDGRTTKYLRLTLNISFFLFKGATDGALPGVAPTYTKATSVGDTTNTVDDDFEIVRQRLSEPCQALNFNLQGLGDFSIQDGTTFDVDNGPKPQVISWKPNGANKICYVEWTVTAAFVNCIQSSGEFGYTQFPFSVGFHVNEAGLTVRTFSGSLGVVTTREPNPGGVRAGASRAFDSRNWKARVDTAFPVLKQFHRTYDFQIAPDRTRMNFTVTDTEIGSDEAYGEGCVREEATLSTSNSIDKVFGKWDVTLSGTIEVAAGYPKAHAYDEITRLFTKFYQVNSVKGLRYGAKQTKKSEADSPPEQKPSRAILRSVHFSDQIFGRSVSFEIRWMLFTTIETLFQATGLFTPVRDNFSQQLQAWQKWSTSLGYVRNSGSGYQGINFTNNDDVIVSLCDNFWQQGSPHQQQNPINQKEKEKPKVKPDKTEMKPEDSWIDYKPQFKVKELTNTKVHKPLEDKRSLPEIPLPSKPTLKEMMLPVDSAGVNPTIIHKSSSSTHILAFSGYAIRANFPVPIPNVESYGNQPVHQIGEGEFVPRKLGLGVDVVTGKSHQLFGLLWRKEYVLTLPPQDVIISSDGHSDLYV